MYVNLTLFYIKKLKYGGIYKELKQQNYKIIATWSFAYHPKITHDNQGANYLKCAPKHKEEAY